MNSSPSLGLNYSPIKPLSDSRSSFNLPSPTKRHLLVSYSSSGQGSNGFACDPVIKHMVANLLATMVVRILTDNVIDFKIRHTVNHLEEHVKERIHVFSCLIYAKLCEASSNEASHAVVGWTKDVGVSRIHTIDTNARPTRYIIADVKA